MMSKRNHDDFRIAFMNDDGVGEASEQQAFDSANPGNAGCGYQRDDVLFEQIERRVDSMLKIFAKSGAFFLILRRRFGGLLGRGRMDTQHAHQARLIRARMRRPNSSRSIRLAVPESISASLRRISASHAFSASDSDGPSRLATRLCANSARSDSERFSASERTFSSVGLPIAVLHLCDSTGGLRIAHLTTAWTRTRESQLNSRASSLPQLAVAMQAAG